MKVLFFSPFANVWNHSLATALVAESFAQHSVDIVAVRCGRMLNSFCVAMSAAGVSPDASQRTKDQVCRACIKRRDLITNEMDIPTLIMDESVHNDDRAIVDRITREVRPDTWTTLELEGIPLGRYAAYEMWINNKLMSTQLAPELWSEYLGQLRNTLLTFLTAKRILAAEKPDAVVVYNDHYSVNHAFCAAAELAGIPSYTIHGGSHILRRSETLQMFTSGFLMADLFRSAGWARYQQNPIGQREIELVGSHFSGLLEASNAFVYSSAFEGTRPAELRSSLGIRPDVPVLLATMSSEDELMGMRLIDAFPESNAKVSLFPSQLEWVIYLLDYARSHSDIHLVLRLHPRMFPNKRENVLSPMVAKVMALRETAPANVSFNMPADGVGLYDLMQIVDVLLNFHSTVGAELATFGIPVVIPSNADFYTYPDELNRIGYTQAEYLQLIDAALVDGWSLENSRRAFRWFAFLFGRASVDLPDAVSAPTIAIRPRKAGPALWLWNRLAFVFLQYGPLVRERRALKNRTVAASSQAILLDVITSRLDSTSESTLWKPIDSTLENETAQLSAYLLQLCSTLWANVEEPESLAGRIRAHLDA